MTIELPTQIVEASTKSPELLIIYSAPKSGKTSLVANLENNLIIDLEKGSNFVSALKVQISSYKELYELVAKIKEANKPYRYLTIDTVTALEDMIGELATKLYQQTPMGKTFTGNVLTLPQGAGYIYIREAFKMMVDLVRGAAERVILLGHVKSKNIEKNGKEVVARELDLAGKLSSITCAAADAVGLLYRDGNKCILNFETGEELICGARPEHLKNKKIIVSEMIDGKLKTYWERIFID